MAKTKTCPNCGAKTRGRVWRMKRSLATNSDGRRLVYANGQQAFGFARRECRKCSWLGDFLIDPQPAPPATFIAQIALSADDDSNDEDYINHYY